MTLVCVSEKKKYIYIFERQMIWFIAMTLGCVSEKKKMKYIRKANMVRRHDT
jgi:hypothetical protein